MMVGAFTAGKGKAEYAYNGFKNRVKKLESLQTNDVTPDPCKEIRYILDMTLPYDNLLMTQGAQNQSFVWGNSLLSANGEEKFHYLQDHLGSPIRLLGGEQNDTALAYDEFGVPVVGMQQNKNNPFGFTGYMTEDVSGLYYAQARYYEPSQGRFGAQDTHWNPENMIYGDNFQCRAFPSVSAIIQSTNLYTYCLCNPLRFIDIMAYEAGEAFKKLDKAVKDFAKTKNSDSIENNWEYGTYFYSYEEPWEVKIFGQVILSGTSTRFSYTNPHTDELQDYVHFAGDDKNKDLKPPIPKESEWVAIGHTHGAWKEKYQNDNFSSGDMALSDKLGIPHHLVSPNGQLKKYDPSMGTFSRISNLSTPWSMPHDKNHPSRISNHCDPCKKCIEEN